MTFLSWPGLSRLRGPKHSSARLRTKLLRRAKARPSTPCFDARKASIPGTSLYSGRPEAGPGWPGVTWRGKWHGRCLGTLARAALRGVEGHASDAAALDAD